MTFKRILKVCCVPTLVAVVFVGLGPSRWQPRSGLGWEIDHFAGYFVITLMFCLAWPRPFVVGAALVVFACLLEALQAIPADRSSNFFAALYSSSAALLVKLFIRGRRWFQSKDI
jgi:hypothetical protein